MSALEREAAGLSADLKARENDVATLLQQKRALEDEVSRAQRALSRGAVETASMAQGELALQVRKYVWVGGWVGVCAFCLALVLCFFDFLRELSVVSCAEELEYVCSLSVACFTVG